MVVYNVGLTDYVLHVTCTEVYSKLMLIGYALWHTKRWMKNWTKPQYCRYRGIVQWNLSNPVTLGTNPCGLIRQITSDLCNMVDNVVLAALYSLRLRLHVDSQSKNAEMYSDSTPSFLLFTRLRFGGFASGSKRKVGVAFSCEHASTRSYT